MQGLTGCGLERERRVKESALKLLAKCYPPHTHKALHRPLLAFAVHFSEEENFLDLLYLELQKAFSISRKDESAGNLEQRMYVLECFQLFALKLARKLTSKVSFESGACKDSEKNSFAFQVIRSAALLLHQEDIAPLIFVFGLLLDPIILKLVGPKLSSDSAVDVMNQILRIATRKRK